MLLLALAACGPATKEEAIGNAAVAAVEPTAATITGPAPIILETGGLRLPGSSPPRTLTFDTPEATAIEAVTAALGSPATERGVNEECGGGSLAFAAWRDNITIWFLDSRFAGWENKGTLKTAGGVGIGSSRADVAALPGFEVGESTLGTEFSAGALNGILASAAPDAKVIHLWAGADCVFR